MAALKTEQVGKFFHVVFVTTQIRNFVEEAKMPVKNVSFSPVAK